MPIITRQTPPPLTELAMSASLGAYGPMRPEELAGLRRRDVDLDNLRVCVRLAEPERMNGRRVQGDTKSEAGAVILPAFIRREHRWHLESYAAPGPDGLLSVGEQGAPFRRSTFGRKVRKVRETVGMPEGFRFRDLRHAGQTLSTRSGATLKDTMVRAGRSSEKAAQICQHPDGEHQQEVAAVPEEPAADPGDQRSGTDLAPPADHSGQQNGPGL
jgi:integrase